jgi:threonyl-tRNA synthetase
MLIIGDRDVEQGTVGVRGRGEDGDKGAMPLQDFLDLIRPEL